MLGGLITPTCQPSSGCITCWTQTQSRVKLFTIRYILMHAFLSRIYVRIVPIRNWIPLPIQLTSWAFVPQNQTPLYHQGACDIRLSILGGTECVFLILSAWIFLSHISDGRCSPPRDIYLWLRRGWYGSTWSRNDGGRGMCFSQSYYCLYSLHKQCNSQKGVHQYNIPKGYDDHVKESKTGNVEITGDAGRVEFVGLWYDRKSGT